MQLLAGLGPLGLPELLIIAFIVVLVFGVGRLPEVGGAVGKGIKEFRKATKDEDAGAGSPSSNGVMQSAPPAAADATSSSGAPAASDTGARVVDTIFCSECGTKNSRTAKFCAQCGASIGTAVSQ